jgi:hypothetical protein
METVSVNREYEAPEHRVCSVFEDVTGFFDAAGFDVARNGDQIKLSKRMAVAQFELHLKLHGAESAALVYEQISGPFETMTTSYRVNPSSAGSCLTIETSFKPPATGIGAVLNDAMVKRQRRSELDAVASLLGRDDGASGRKPENSSARIGGD